jgi:hypothetical protein
LDDTNRNPPNLELRTNSKLAIIEFTIKEISDKVKPLNIRERRPFNLMGGGVVTVFCFVQNFFFRSTQELEYFFFFVGQSEFFSLQNLTLGYMTNTLNQIIFFSSTKIRIFFSATLGIRIFF